MLSWSKPRGSIAQVPRFPNLHERMCAYAPVQALGVFPASQKDVIGFGVYYGIVGAAVAAGALLGWNLTLPMLLLLVVVLFCCMGGRNYIGEWQIYQDNPMAATEYDQGSRDYRALPLVRSLLLLLPPTAYFFVRLLFLLI